MLIYKKTCVVDNFSKSTAHSVFIIPRYLVEFSASQARNSSIFGLP